MTPLCLVAPDLHLADSAWQHKPMRGDAYDAFARIVSMAVEHKVPLIAPGDCFDKNRPPPSAVIAGYLQVDRLYRAGIPFYHVVGNHDLTQDGASWFIHPHATRVHGVAFEIGGVSFAGLDYVPADRLAASIAALPDAEVLVCHQPWAEWMGEERSDGRLASIERFKFVITGDNHKDVGVFDLVADDGRPMRALSPGSSCMQESGESPNKAAWLVWRRDDGDLTATALDYRGRSRIGVEATSTLGLDRVVAELPGQIAAEVAFAASVGLAEHLRHPIVVAEYLEDIPEAYARLRATMADPGYLFARPRRAELEPELPGASTAAVVDLRSALQARVAADDVDYALAMRLVEGTDDPASVLRAAREELLSTFTPIASNQPGGTV